MLSPSDLDAIRKRVEAASPPPWDSEPQASLSTRPRYVIQAAREPRVRSYLIAEEVTESDAQFIAHARTDVPALLDEVHSLRHLLMRACGEIFGGVVMRPFMIEELRKHHVVEPPHSQDK